MDDPVSCIDPTGLATIDTNMYGMKPNAAWPALVVPLVEWLTQKTIGEASKHVGKKLGKSIGKSFFNDTLNDDEEMIHVRNKINAIEAELEHGPLDKNKMKELEENRAREDALLVKHGDSYTGYSREFYRQYFPDEGYVDRQLVGAQERHRQRERAKWEREKN